MSQVLPDTPNGLAERAAQSVKTLLERSKRDNSNMYLGLLLIRNTPRDNNLNSSAERLLSQKKNPIANH